MITQRTVNEVWELTRPLVLKSQIRYFKTLVSVLNTSKKNRFREPFKVAKKSGGFRTIVPAGPELVIVQNVIAGWLIREFPPVNDYCYNGAGVLRAVRVHLHSTTALTIDLKGAFDHVTRSRLNFWLTWALVRHGVSLDAIEVICDLLTYPVSGKEETTPQGCVSTPYAYNLVMHEIDKQISMVLRKYKGMKVTRYSDNFCISAPFAFDTAKLLKNVRAVISANGFEVGSNEYYPNPPFGYLGTLIFKDHLAFANDKYGEYLEVIDESMRSGQPNAYRSQILGIFSWAKQVYGKTIPSDLLNLLENYFEKVRRPPKNLTKIVSERGSYRF